MAKLKFYNLDRIQKTRSDFYLIIGQRGNGKTYSVCKYFLNKYKETRKRFCYIRRWADDIKGYRAEQLFTPLQKEIESLFGEGYTIQYYRHKYYLVNADGEKLDVVGHAVSLSECSHTKSVAFDNVFFLLYDEFIQMSGERTLRDEMSKFDNTISTVLRYREGEIYLCANTVSKFSPYFVRFGIDINKVEQGQIITKEYPLDDEKGILRVSLEYCEYNEEIGKKSSKYTQSKMIARGMWEIPETTDIPSVIGEIVKDKLLCSIYDPDAEITLGIFLRRSKWVTIENDEESLIYTHQEHEREFLIVKQIDYRSNYFHLSDQKSLSYNTYNDISYFLRDILDGTDIDIEQELYMGRIFCDNMFTADYFNHVWGYYGQMTPRKLL